MSTLLGRSECQPLKEQGHDWIICPPTQHRVRQIQLPRQRRKRTRSEARTEFPLPEFFLALQRRPVCDRSHIRPLQQVQQQARLQGRTPIMPAREEVTGVKSLSSSRCPSEWRYSNQRHFLCGLVSVPSAPEGRCCHTRCSPWPFEVRPTGTPPHPKCPKGWVTLLF